MVKPITKYVTQKRLSWYGHVRRIDDKNFGNEITMKVVGNRYRGRHRLKWMDIVRSDMKEYQLDPKLAQNREAWRQLQAFIQSSITLACSMR